jgi:uncharacterized membrane protein
MVWAHNRADTSNLEKLEMNAIKLTAMVLIVGGVLGLLYGSFSYTKDTHDLKIGPLALSIEEKKTVNIPIWLGVGAVVMGGLLLVFGSKRG